MHWLSAVLRLIRWENALIAGVGVVVGAWWVGGDITSRATLLTAGAAVALAAVANSYNDLGDIEIDRIAHPERPLPSGALSERSAQRIFLLSAVLAVALSTAASKDIGLASVCVIAVMTYYSLAGKRAGLVGNLIVAALASLPFVYGGWSVGRPLEALPLFALAVPLHLARDVAKDIEDVAGDSATRRTIPVAWGARAARNVLLGAFGAFLGMLISFARTRPAFAVAVIPAVALATYAAFQAAQGKRGAPRVFKYAMLCAMGALLVVRDQ